MADIRVYELARELGTDSKELVRLGREKLKLDIASHLHRLRPAEADKLRELFRQERAGDVEEKRVAPTVKRRRSRRKVAAATAVRPAPAATTSPAAAASVPASVGEAGTGAPAAAKTSAEESVKVATPAEAVAPAAPAVPPAQAQEAEVRAATPAEAAEAEQPQAAQATPSQPPQGGEQAPQATEERPDTQPEAQPAVVAAEPGTTPPAPVTPSAAEETVEVPEVPPAPRPPATAQPVAVAASWSDGQTTVQTRGPSTMRVDPQGRPTETRAVVIAPPDPNRMPPPRTTPVRRRPGTRPGGARPGAGRMGMGPVAPASPGPGGGPGSRRARTGREADKPGQDRPKRRGRRIVDRRGGWDPRHPMTDEDLIPARRARRSARSRRGQAQGAPQTVPKESKRVVKVGETITVSQLAQRLGVKAAEVVGKLFAMGQLVRANDNIDADTAEIIADEFGYRIEREAFDLEKYLPQVEDREEDLVPRPPVITVMGHVDHGKTTLLDYIRKSRVAAGEAGGITQHIGAYAVKVGGGKVVFLDTPGHEAFTAMRARGAQATDIVVLVVAADDGVMPQTIEAISHAREAGVPIVVAITKTDKPNANVERVKQQLTEQGLVPEEWGGDTIVIPVSGVTGEGVDKLLEMLLLQAELLELKANPKRPAEGVIVESRLEKGLGPVATVIVQKGTLKKGDYVVAGSAAGRVRLLLDDTGKKQVKQATPGTPVQVVGFTEVPEPSHRLYVVANEKTARFIAEHYVQEARKRAAGEVEAPKTRTFEELVEAARRKELPEVKVVLKGDTQGTLEALRQALEKIKHDEVCIRIIHSAVGGISESDVQLASASDALVIGFNVRADAKARKAAKEEGIEIRTYSVIYEVIDDIKKAMAGLLGPRVQENVIGHAEVRQVFSVSKVGNVAGCMVLDGVVRRHAKVKLYRDDKLLWEGRLASLKRFKDDVREVKAGYECGIRLDGYQDIKVGDIIEAIELEEVEATLD